MDGNYIAGILHQFRRRCRAAKRKRPMGAGRFRCWNSAEEFSHPLAPASKLVEQTPHLIQISLSGRKLLWIN